MKKLIAIVLTALMLLTFTGLAETPVEGMPNPWLDTTAEGLMEALGVEFKVPEGAENV